MYNLDIKDDYIQTNIMVERSPQVKGMGSLLELSKYIILCEKYWWIKTYLSYQDTCSQTTRDLLCNVHR